MLYEEFKQHTVRAGLTLKDFAELLKLNVNSLSNYAKDNEVPSHLAVVATLMSEMAVNGLDFKKVLANVDIKSKKVRGAAAKGKFGGDKG